MNFFNFIQKKLKVHMEYCFSIVLQLQVQVNLTDIFNFFVDLRMRYHAKEKKSFYQNKKLEMLNYIKDSLERKIASVTASIEVLESQISRDKEVEVTN